MTQLHMFNQGDVTGNLLEWKRRFLHNRNLDEPDGRPLYAYKMTKSEFEELEQLFHLWIQNELKSRSLEYLVESVPLFNGLFVLYAAEWWKRKYSEGHWTWQLILDDLGIKHNHWSAPKRSQSIEDGFKQWKLKLKDNTGKRFLGSVALQGGLPMNLLAHNDRSISYVLQRTIDLIGDSMVNRELVTSWIENLSIYIPITYQRNEIYELLADIIFIIEQIKRETNSSESKEVIKNWQNNIDYWASKFPIPVGRDKTEDLIERLIERVAQKSERKKYSDFINFSRKIYYENESPPSIKAEILFKEQIQIDNLANLFTVNDKNKLTVQLTVVVETSESSSEVYLRKSIGTDAYRCKTKIIDLNGKQAIEAIKIKLRNTKGDEWNVDDEQININQLDDSLPWIFEDIKQEYETADFIGQGSSKISAESCLMLVKPDWKITPDTSASFTNSSLYNRSIVRVLDNLYIETPEDIFYLKTKQVEELEKSFILAGEKCQEMIVNPSLGFKGIPTVYQRNELGRIKQVDNVIWLHGGKEYSKPFYGPATLTVRENSYTHWKRDLVIIPEEASQDIEFSNRFHKGNWILEDWKIHDLNSLNSQIEIKKVDEDKWEIDYTGNEYPPEYFYAEAVWGENINKGKLKLEFPGKGVRLFDLKQNLLPEDYQVAINNLHGLRFHILPGDSDTVQLFIDLVDYKTTTYNKSFHLEFNEDQYSKSIRPIDFYEYFEAMLAATEETDAFVNFEVLLDGHKYASLAISHYSFSLDKGDDYWAIPANTIDNEIANFNKDLVINVQRIDEPGVEHLQVPIAESGLLQLPKENMSPGPWLIYPDSSSNIIFRPSLHIINGELIYKSAENGLKLALRLQNRQEREGQIQKCLQGMVINPEHNDWNVLAQLISEFGHLPLSSLDIWNILAHNYDAMALLSIGHIKNMPENFLDRFSQELPFLFEFIPVKSWIKAIRVIDPTYTSTELSDDLIFKILKSILKVNQWHFDAFKNAFFLGIYFNKDIISREFKVVTEEFIDESLFIGNKSEYQRIRRIKGNTEWPEIKDLSMLIDKYKKGYEFIYYDLKSFRKTVINTPIFLAQICAEGQNVQELSDPRTVTDIKRVKEFDEEWFIHAFNFTLARFFLNDNLNIATS